MNTSCCTLTGHGWIRVTWCDIIPDGISRFGNFRWHLSTASRTSFKHRAMVGHNPVVLVATIFVERERERKIQEHLRHVRTIVSHDQKKVQRHLNAAWNMCLNQIGIIFWRIFGVWIWCTSTKIVGVACSIDVMSRESKLLLFYLGQLPLLLCYLLLQCHKKCLFGVLIIRAT